MKYKLTLTTFLTIAFMMCIPLAYSQMDIRMQWKNQKFDSVSVRAYGENNTFNALYTKPFESKMAFKSKTSLEPGIYWVFGDSTMVEAFLISSDKGQKFTMVMDTTGTEFQNSPENTANLAYVHKVQEYDKQSMVLEQDFQEALGSGMPSYMMQVLVDSLTVKALNIEAEKEAFQWKAVKENAGTLLASVIQASILPEQAPQEMYNDIQQMQAFVVRHFFDNFPWNDPRVFNTPIVENRLLNFCEMIYQFDRTDLDTFVVDALQKARKANPKTYYLLFDDMEKRLGSYTSMTKVEHAYIPMLKDALSYPELEPARRTRYEKELSIIDKNHEGDKVPNFKMVFGKTDTTSLYDVQADYLILYLEHPTCPTCKTTRSRMGNDPILNNAISEGKIKVLTVYFEDDPVVWEMYLRDEANPDYLHGWNFDQSIEKKGLYDIRTIPYMFLLDKDKKVIKKDLLVNEIEDYIRQISK